MFGFGMKPGTPPTEVIYIIIAAVTCAGILQASGGMDWLIQLAERLLRRHPGGIVFLAPLCTFFLTVLVGTGHVVYTLMPIIVDISIKKNIRPERPCAVASVASQVGIICSPIAAAVVAFVGISNMSGFDITIPQVLFLTIPSCLCGILAAAACSYKRGLDLDKDPVYQEKLRDPEQRKYILGDESATTLGKEIPRSAKAAVFVFLGALAVIVMFAVFPQLLPEYTTIQAVKGAASVSLQGGADISAAQLAKAGVLLPGATEEVSKDIRMNVVIQIVILTAAALMIMFCRASPKKAVSGAVWQSGMVAVVAIYGIAWLADISLDHRARVLRRIGAHQLAGRRGRLDAAACLLAQHPGTGAPRGIPFGLRILFYSELPFLPGPNNPSDIATVNFDRTGTTVIGKYLLNHSFMMPGLVSVIVSTLVGYTLSLIFY